MDDDATAVLAANQAFYDAFSAGDAEAMARVWSRTEPVACIHPGGPALHGRELVVESWRHILGAAEHPTVRCRGAQAHLLGDTAFVTCYEDLGGGVLVATNVFARRNGAWHLVHHQAGPAMLPSPRPARPTPDPKPPGRVLH